MTRVLFPGTFDPFTLGHDSVVRRTLAFADELTIGIGLNEAKHAWLPAAKRVEAVRRLYAAEPRIRVEGYDGLTIDFARHIGATLIVRGIRSTGDFEYERAIADINRRLGGIDTLLLPTEPELASISSSVVRELHRYGQDIRPFLPPGMEVE